ncbi:hypothetical protein GQ53DRAFT_847897 [Thozetella sp. PMI_491]|nr:hypothetical protein GQ53DRAFT_847897 [Thozetella sp. PMI_491]
MSFRALEFLNGTYENLHGASINLEIVQRPLFTSEWVRALFGGSPTPRSRSPVRGGGIDPHVWVANTPLHLLQVTFSCIAMCESGELDIHPSLLSGVIALSAGDSIFVSASMISDPANGFKVEKPLVQRVFGNLGRPALSFLVPPTDPKLRGYNPADWHLINHAPFDGLFQDSFCGTSLHLSYTDFEMPIDVGLRGLRDAQAVLLESIISVDHRGRHLGDLDIMSIFDNVTIISKCDHKAEDNPVDNATASIVSLDCWEEFFDAPAVAGIFRARGNWQARLAAAAASVQTGRRTLLLPSYACLECLKSATDQDHYEIIIA